MGKHQWTCGALRAPPGEAEMARHERRQVMDGGAVVIPADFRRDLGVEPGDDVVFEQRDDGSVLLRAADSASAHRD